LEEAAHSKAAAAAAVHAATYCNCRQNRPKPWYPNYKTNPIPLAPLP